MENLHQFFAGLAPELSEKKKSRGGRKEAGCGRWGSLSLLFRTWRAPCMDVKDISHMAASKALLVGLLPLDIISYAFNFQEPNFEFKNIHLF